jgi:hypothetical protein
LSCHGNLKQKMQMKEKLKIKNKEETDCYFTNVMCPLPLSQNIFAQLASFYNQFLTLL